MQVLDQNNFIEPARTRRLHSGHVDLCRSHDLMQAAWNRCAQGWNTETSSVDLHASRQTEHVSPCRSRSGSSLNLVTGRLSSGALSSIEPETPYLERRPRVSLMYAHFASTTKQVAAMPMLLAISRPAMTHANTEFALVIEHTCSMPISRGCCADITATTTRHLQGTCYVDESTMTTVDTADSETPSAHANVPMNRTVAMLDTAVPSCRRSL